MRDDSICRRKSRYTAFFLILLVIISIPAVTAEPLPDIRHIFIGVANDDGVKYDLDGPVYGGPNNTYYIKADGGGLNELHISDDVSQANGQVSTVTNQSGTFYVTNTGGRGFDDDIVILLAVNGTIPDDFSVHIKTSGYNWTTSSVVNQLPADFTYVEGAVDETFTKADFIYGPQTWKPGPGTLGVPSMPLYFGQDISDTTNSFQLMFIDLKVGNMYPSKFSGVTLENNGAAKVEFSFTNLTTFATFNGYGWCLAANQGQGISWTNRMDDPGASGFSVVGIPYVPSPAPVADFSTSTTDGIAPLFVRFTDTSSNSPTSWAWDFGDGSTSTDQNPTHTYMTAGAYTVTLIVTNPSGSDNEVKTGIITVTAASTANGLADSAWPKFGGNAQNTGQSPYVGSKNGTPKWSYTIPGISGSSFKYTTPVIGLDGTIYLGDTASNISAINPDGTLKWETAIGIGSNSPFAIGTDGTLFVGGFDTGTLTNGKIYAVNPSDGTKKWTSSALTGACVYSGPAIGADGTVYGGNYLNQFCALFPENGTSKWSYTTGQIYNYGSPAIGYDGIVYVTSQSDKMLYAINPDGSPRWNFTAGGTFSNSPAIGADGTIYVACYDKNLYAINPDGSQKWNYTAGNYFYTGSPAVANDGTIYAGNQDKNVYAIDSEGNLKWKSLLASRVWSTPTIGADGTVYIEDQNSILYALNPANGNQIWSYTTSGRVDGAASIAPDGTVYVATENRVLYAFPGVVDFTSDKTSGSAPFDVRFNGVSPLAVTAWNWDFGDGSTSTEQNPEHTYTATGNYTVTLTITHADGTNFLEKPGYITVNAPEPRTWTVGASGCDFTNITDALSNSALYDGDTVYVYNGTYTHTSTLTVPESITLTGEDASVVSFSINKGLTFSNSVSISGIRFKDSTSSSFYLRGANTVVKNCMFENGKKVYLYGPALRFENNTVIGVPLSSNNDDQLFLNNSFSDLSSDKGLSVKGNNLVIDGNSFSNYGTSGICFDSALTNITISRNNFLSGASILLMEPAPGVTNYIYQNNFLTISDIACNGVPLGTNVWNTTNPVTYTYLTTGSTGFLGNYWASRYTGIDGNGDGVGDTPYTFAILSTSMTDYAPLMDRYEYYFGSVHSPTASFDSDIQSGTAPLTASFTDTSTGSPTSWAWDFENDGVVDSTEQNPSHIYTSAGTYTVNLTVTNPGGSDGEIKRDYITVSELSGPFILPDYNYIFVRVANDAGVKYDSYLNNTYNIRFAGAGRGLNAHHITTDPVFAPYGQVTSTTNMTGIFYITDTGGSGFADNVVIMVAVNGTIPDNFSVHIRTSGYNWTPMPGLEEKPPQSAIQYLDGAVDETFTRDDLLYGPMTWKPSGETNPYPIYAGQDMANSSDTFHYMFVDAYVGQLGTNSGMSGLTDSGAVKVEYTIENIPESVVFNSYCWNSNANQGPSVIAWTNNLIGGHNGDSGYNVLPAVIQAPVAAFACDVSDGQVPLIVQFTDASTGNPTSWAWDFENDGVVDSTEQNPLHTYSSAGTFTVNLTVINDDGSNSEVKTDYISVSGSSGASVLPGYNYIFVRVANDDGVKYNSFDNDTYNIRFEGVNRGLNALHISTDPAVNFGQVTVTDSQSGTFYATDSGGKGYEDEVILLVAVNGTIPDDFSLHITSDGYTWTPNPVSNQPPSLDEVTYQPVALDETFTREDFIYGPQIWKPTGNEADYPIYAGQDLSDTENTFQLMFVDLNAGVLRPDTGLENQGAVRINYTFTNLDSFATFSVYAYCQKSNNGDDMVAWTNALTPDKAMSGYSVFGKEGTTPVAEFNANITSGTSPLSVQFTDMSAGSPTAWSWSFGDGYTSAEQSPVHTYASEGSYQVNLTVSNEVGTDTREKAGYITVTSTLPKPPLVNFIGDNRTGPAPLTVHFTDQSTNTPTAWAWDFENDGIIDSTDQNPTHTYTTAGTYQVNLTASNAGGSANRLKGNYIQVTSEGNSNPVVDFSADSRDGMAPFTVQFTDLSVTDPTAWAWDFENDGVIDSTLQNPAHTYTIPGTYQVNLSVTNASGTANRLKANFIHVSAPSGIPVATFTVDTGTGRAPCFVRFTDTSTGDRITGYEWDFGDGAISTQKNPTHLYRSAGTYTVTLNVNSETGAGTAIGTIKVTGGSITPGGTLNARFTSSPTAGRAPLEVQFTDRSNGATTWNWDFGDGSTSTEQNPVHIFTTSGTYKVTLSVNGTDGSDSTTGTVMVIGTAVTPGGTVNAQFISSPMVGRAPLEVQFTDRSSGATTWNWDFGDGSTSTEQNPVHTYTTSGTYRVSLSVSGTDGTDTATGTIMVTGGAVTPGGTVNAQFISNPMVGRAPLEVQFTDRSTGATTWNWNFGDGSTSTEQNPVHVFSISGTYKVTLSISGTEGSDSTTGTVMVISGSSINPGGKTNAQFTASPKVGRAPLEVQFSDRSSWATNQSWDFGDGMNSTELNPVHIFTDKGTYKVSLTVTIGNNIESATETIWVI